MSTYTYGATHRPIGYATVPKGWTDVGSHPVFKCGIVTYDRPLTMDEVQSYELTIIPSKEEIHRLASDISRDLARSEEDVADVLQLYREERPSFVRGIAQKIEFDEGDLKAARKDLAEEKGVPEDELDEGEVAEAATVDHTYTESGYLASDQWGGHEAQHRLKEVALEIGRILAPRDE